MRMAVIGAGRMGTLHARRLARMPDVDLVGVADVNEARARALAGELGCRSFGSHASLIVTGRPEGVVVALPPSEQVTVGCDVLESGIAALIEKPVAPDLEAAERLTSVCASSGSLLVGGYVERFNPVFGTLSLWLREGLVGDPIVATTRRFGTNDRPAHSSDVLMDLAVHDVDLMHALFGQTVFASAARPTRVLSDGVWAAADIALKLPEATVVCSAGWSARAPERTIASRGPRGVLRADLLTGLLRFRGRDGSERSKRVSTGDSLTAQLEHFVRLAMGPIAARPPACEAVRALRTVCLARGAALDPGRGQRNREA